jgi:peptidoglycan/LPS O-acetylase OafA/YrhL
VGWSLSVEMFFYLLFPLVIIGARRLSAVMQMSAVIAMIAAEYVWDLSWWAHTEQPLEGWLLGGFPPVRLLEFAVGVLLALLVREGRLRGVRLWWALPFAAAGYVADGFAPAGLTTVPCPVVPFAVLIVAAANSDLRGSVSLLRARWLVKLGEWSFAFYLLHQMVLRVLAVTSLGGRPAGLAFALEALIIATVLAAALFTFLERPLDRWLRGDGTLPVTEQ